MLNSDSREHRLCLNTVSNSTAPSNPQQALLVNLLLCTVTLNVTE